MGETEKLYIASMVLAGVGDSMGYKCGDWEFCFDGEKIHEEAKSLGGVKALRIQKPGFIVSDDTVLLLSTAEALVDKGKENFDKLYPEIAFRYQKDFSQDMGGRAGGMTTGASCHALRPMQHNGWHLPFNPRGGGCGAAMRAMGIGLRYPNVFDQECLEKLIAVSVESGRMTHNNPTGYLGSFASAFFASLSISKVPILKWGMILLQILPKVLAYIEKEGRDVSENKNAWSFFEGEWNKYLDLRKLSSGDLVSFPDEYGIKQRDAFYKSLAFHARWGGASGHDAPMIAYDALLFAKDDWITLCEHGMLHSGDNDSTGIISGFCFGALYGLNDVPKCNYEKVEYKSRLINAAQGLYKLALEDGYLPVEIPEEIDVKLHDTINSLFSS